MADIVREGEFVLDERGHGLALEPCVEGEHFVLGGYSDIGSRFGGQVLMPGGHGWSKYKPTKELQNRFGFETMGCTVFGTLNALETLANFKGFKDFPTNCSDRYGNIMAGTNRNGNDPHHVIEVFRTISGVVPEQALPWGDDIDSWDEYYFPIPMDEATVNLGQQILKKFSLGHEWVFNGTTIQDRQGKLMAAMEKGTVCVSVFAWKKRGDLYFKELGDMDQHWLELVDFKEGKYWEVYDHYDDTTKRLEWNYAFIAAKVYYLDRRAAEPTVIESLQIKLLGLLTQLYNLLRK